MSDSDIPPCAMIKVFTVEPPETEWKKHSQTEISEVTTKRVNLVISCWTLSERLKFILVYKID